MDIFSKLLQLYSNKKLNQAQRNVEGAKIDLDYFQEEQQATLKQIEFQEELIENYRKITGSTEGQYVEDRNDWINILRQEIQRHQQYIVNARNIILMNGVQ